MDAYDKIVERSGTIAVLRYPPPIHPMEQHVSMFVALCEYVDKLEAEIERVRGYAGAPARPRTSTGPDVLGESCEYTEFSMPDGDGSARRPGESDDLFRDRRKRVEERIAVGTAKMTGES